MDSSSSAKAKVERHVVVKVEDDRMGMSFEAVRRAVLDHLTFTRCKDMSSATLLDVFFSLAYAVRDRLVHRWMRTKREYQQHNVKRVYYLSAEFLLGRFLANNLINLGLYDMVKKGLAEHGVDLADVLEQEPDPGLGNGGLGRLAACYLDSMATLELPGYGYGLRYEFGIFRQELVNGLQVEKPDNWLLYGNPWEIARPEYTVEVHFGGRVEQSVDPDGKLSVRWLDTHRVLGVPFDYPIIGHDNSTVNTLRLWQARASKEFDLAVFNDGDYRRAVEEKELTETISKVLYPKDDSMAGKELRLQQQYFFVACSIHDIVRRYKKAHSTFDAFPDKVALQLNDTHPAIAVAELMRVLVDREALGWERAWDITQRSTAYTNHTLLPEALEKWPLELFQRLLPRHLQLIYEINHRFLRHVHVVSFGDHELKRRVSIIDEGSPRQVRMAHLAVVGSHSINGVAALHSELLRTNVLRDFAELYPERFNNKTNGVSPRRWLLVCNPRLSAAITARIGDGWIKDLPQLERLAPLADDPAFCEELRIIKYENKLRLAALIEAREGVHVSPDSLFDVQVKRIHEYKRQLLNCLHVIALYRRLKFDGGDITPRTVIFGGKAAPGYVHAKKHIKLINDVAAIINADPAMEGRLRCVFMSNYCVSLAETIIPAADLSEQISMAGKEASGTGNMKFQMNGALTIGTLDGANVEIREEVGADNFFLFGMDAPAAAERRRGSYDPSAYIRASDTLRAVIEMVDEGFFAPEQPDLHRAVVRYLRNEDPYLICADFDDYVACQARVEAAYADPRRWTRMVVANIAHSGKFSSDRSIQEYARQIWNVEPMPVPVDPEDAG